MKTLAIVSDTHGNRRALDKLEGVFAECDYIIHLGDTSQDGAYIRANHPNKTYLVNGNCDGAKFGEDELTLRIEGLKIFATHGHLYSAKSASSKLLKRANELNCDIVLYGHTHRAREEDVDGVKLINPGTLSRYSRNSYCYLVINDKKAVCKIVELI